MDSDIANDSADTSKETEAKFKYDWAKQSFKDAGDGINNADDYEKWAKNLFIKCPAQMKLLIGFDAPCATVLYIDNEIKDHTLFQAVCRVNRLGEDIKDEEGNVIVKTHKEFGRVISFKNLFDSIEDAYMAFKYFAKTYIILSPSTTFPSLSTFSSVCFSVVSKFSSAASLFCWA